jgi:hypothetical protein
MADHEDLNPRISAPHDIDVNAQVFHIVVEAVDAAPFSLGTAVSAVVRSAYREACGDKLIHEVEVTPAMLSQAVHYH